MSQNDRSFFKSLALIVVSAGFIGFVAWKMPLIEMLYLFVMIALVPALWLMAIGIVSKETVNILLGGPEAFRARVQNHIDEIRAAQAAAAASAA